MFGKLLSMFDGGLSDVVEKAGDLIEEYIPSDSKKLEMHQKMWALQQEAKDRAAKIAHEQDVEFNQRVKDLEGTSKDLLALPFVGRLLLVARGLQRPIWGFATLYFDYKWFQSASVFTEQQQTALTVINVLVLGFLFGERAMQNVMPLVERVFLAKGK